MRLIVGTLALALWAGVAAAEADRQVYELRHGVEMANGFTVYAESKRMRVVRERRGDESLMLYNLLEGVRTTEGTGGMMGLPIRLPPEDVVDAAYRYDYTTRTLHGPEAFTGYFNTYIRPHLDEGPVEGDRSFAVPLTLGDLGIRIDGDFEIRIGRTFVEHEGETYALISFEVPAFAWTLPTGEEAVHWARGFAVTDADYAVVYYMAARHKAVAGGGTPDERRLAWTNHAFATDFAGKPLLVLEDFDAARALMAEMSAGDDADVPHQLREPTEEGFPLASDRTFFAAAGAMTNFAFALAENGANQIPASGSTTQTAGGTENGSMALWLRAMIASGSAEARELMQSLDRLPQAQKLAEMERARASFLRGGADLYESLRAAEVEYSSLGRNSGYSQLMQDGIRLERAGDATGAARLFARAQALVPELNRLSNAAFERVQDASRAYNAYMARMPGTLGKGYMVVQQELARREAAAFITRQGASVVSRLMGGLRTIGTAANGANTLEMLRRSVFGDARDFASTSGGTYDQNAAAYLDSVGSRLFWQLADIGASGATGDWVNMGISGVGIAAQSVGDARAAYVGMLDADYEELAAAADLRLTMYRRNRQDLDGLKADIARADASIQELKDLFDQLERQRRVTGPATGRSPREPAPPPEPELTEEEMIAGLALTLDELDPGYPTVSKERREEIRRRAEERRKARAAEDAELEDLLADLFDEGDEEVIDPELWEDWCGTDLFTDSEEFDALDAALLAMLETLADPAAQEITLPEIDFQDYVDDNAFSYNNMSGRVPTDLSAYEAWLATQDLRRLEDLARAAGYPNLASALADWQSLIKRANDQGWRDWALSMPVGTGLVNIGFSQQQRDLARAQLILGDILNQSRFVESIGGLTDVRISSSQLGLTLIDFGLEDGDVVTLVITQLGRTLLNQTLTLRNAGDTLAATLRPGVAAVSITALNEGFASPNTARVVIDDVVEGVGDQSYSLQTGESAVLRVEVDR